MEKHDIEDWIKEHDKKCSERQDKIYYKFHILERLIYIGMGIGIALHGVVIIFGKVIFEKIMGM